MLAGILALLCSPLFLAIGWLLRGWHDEDRRNRAADRVWRGVMAEIEREAHYVDARREVGVVVECGRLQ